MFHCTSDVLVGMVNCIVLIEIVTILLVLNVFYKKWTKYVDQMEEHISIVVLLSVQE